jgi:LysR family glycine cleavage system transcriptional activator
MIMAVSPPRPKDLPLNALRAFEAAARLGGFAAAAQELGVTPGAVTAHVKTLEAQLGAALFERTARGVELNALGQRVLPGFIEAFDALGEAVQTLRSEAAPRTVHIATLPSIAQLWLSPRLPALREAAPGISISITAMEEPPNLKRAAHDLCLFYGGETQGALARDVIFPVCAPGVAQRRNTPADLAAATCISDAAWAGDWAAWAKVAMPGVAFSPRWPVYSLYTLAVAEAVNGAGVLIGHESLVSDHLRRGELVAPFDVRVTLDRHLRLWSNRPLAKGSAAARVSAWLRGSG